MQEVIAFIKKYQSLFVVVIIGSLGVALVASALQHEEVIDWQTEIGHIVRPEKSRALDGVLVRREEATLRPIAVMIENHVDSRPVAGIEQARVIYESIVEGDITRFLAIFDPTFSVKRIGPVRSARPFFVELAQEYDPVYFHAGGSPEALAMIRAGALENVNEISADGIYFFRETRRFAPHNLFTSANQMLRAVELKEYSTSASFAAWRFSDSVPDQLLSVDEVNFSFSSNPDYEVNFFYNAEDENYTRYQANNPHYTESGILLKADTVIKQYVDAEIIDSYGRLAIDLESGGPVAVYRDGIVISGTWEKEDGRTRFFDDEGEEIRLKPGVIWIGLFFN